MQSFSFPKVKVSETEEIRVRFYFKVQNKIGQKQIQKQDGVQKAHPVPSTKFRL